MVVPDLVTPADLAEQPGAPFSAQAAQTAGETIRRIAGWHIAPSITETVTLDHDGAGVLMLPSLYVTNVTAVRDVSGDTPVDLTGWRWSPRGMISGRFPCGFRTVEVEFTHGYDPTPADLMPVAASSTSGRVRVEQDGPFSTTYSDVGNTTTPDAVLARYTLPPRP